jgi:AraC family transcriptional regulator
MGVLISTRKTWFQDRSSRPNPAELVGEAHGVRVSLVSDRPGLVAFSGAPGVAIAVHVGPSVAVDCRRGGERYRGTVVHGDIEVIAPNLPGTWEIEGSDSALIVRLGPALLHRAVLEQGADPGRFEVRNRFQLRDPRIEHIAWALKAEMEHGNPCGRMYLEGLATGLAALVVRDHGSLARRAGEPRPKGDVRAVRPALACVEDNLGREIGLAELADACGMSVSRFKVEFRRAMGVPAHQYLIRRRVERAALLLRRGGRSIARVALETGFAHQSHLALHMRRVLGVTPREVRNGN